MNPNEPADHGALVAILAMAGATYAMRAGGFWLMGHVPMTRRVERMLAALPGSIIAATVLPVIANDGLAGALAIGGAALVMAVRRNDFLAVIAGMSIAAAVRVAGL